MDGSEMATELQQGNAIAMEQLELTRQQMLQSVEMLRIEAKKLEVAEAAYYAQLRAQFVEDYDRVFLGTRGDAAMRRLRVHDPLYALSLIAKDVQTSYESDQLPVDLSMDIALVMVHGSPAAHRHLVTIFAREYFLGLEPSGTFQQELATIVDAIAQILAEQEQAKRLEAEAKQIAEAEAKRIADAKHLTEEEAYHATSTLVPQKILNDEEWKNSFTDSGQDLWWKTTLSEQRAMLSTLMYHLQQGNVRKNFYPEKGFFGHTYYSDQIAGVKVSLRDLTWSYGSLFFFARKIVREAGMDFATAKWVGAKDAFLRLYPRYSVNVRFRGSTLRTRLDYHVESHKVCAAYALHHGTPDMFPTLSRAQLDKIRANNMSGMYQFSDGYIAHCYLMATEPEYVEFIKALHPYYIPNWLKR
ncbi:MAG: hypothetical protein EAY76_04100 [Alphaproteobacteria bacterium]|nr:MAG: hypothetical protein EAY76_04100 [Alphaproteobacteria bacterium]